MCNLNILIKKKTDKSTDKVADFMMAVTSHSYTDNHDGDGVYFNNGVLYKGGSKIGYSGLKCDIDNSNVIIAHQRVATSGRTVEFSHPFESEDFVLAHNGILNEFLNGGSDTHGFFMKFIETFNLAVGQREERIIYSIKKLLDNLLGYYSIILYDKITECSYYFRESKASIYSYKNKDYLYITTNRENSLFLELIGESKDFNEMKFKPYRIYKIFLDDESIIIQKVGKIAHAEYSCPSSCLPDINNFGFSIYSNNPIPVKDTVYEIETDSLKKVNRIVEVSGKYQCNFCNSRTSNYCQSTDEYICDECIMEGMLPYN